MNKKILFLSCLFFTTVFYASDRLEQLPKSASVHQMSRESGSTPTPVIVETRPGSSTSEIPDHLLGQSIRQTPHIEQRGSSPDLQYLEKIFRCDYFKFYHTQMSQPFTRFEQQEFETFKRAWRRIQEIQEWNRTRNIDEEFRTLHRIPQNERLTDSQFKALQKYIQRRRNEERQ
jgi:hypothetical protein